MNLRGHEAEIQTWEKRAAALLLVNKFFGADVEGGGTRGVRMQPPPPFPNSLRRRLLGSSFFHSLSTFFFSDAGGRAPRVSDMLV